MKTTRLKKNDDSLLLLCNFWGLLHNTETLSLLVFHALHENEVLI